MISPKQCTYKLNVFMLSWIVAVLINDIISWNSIYRSMLYVLSYNLVSWREHDHVFIYVYVYVCVFVSVYIYSTRLQWARTADGVWPAWWAMVRVCGWLCRAARRFVCTTPPAMRASLRWTWHLLFTRCSQVLKVLLLVCINTHVLILISFL